MPLDIPYTFIAGTKAKASEVNSNFQAVKTITDQNEVNIAQAEIDITTLQTTKADLNGAIENRFEVADPNGDYDAVNLQTFERLTANTRDYISGFVLSKYSNDTISATPGSCYDSTGEYIFTSASALQVSQSNLGANATYYVYITGGPEASNQLVISSSNTQPELPVGATLFRLLGSFTTDGDGYINNMFSNSNSVSKSDLSNFESICPDYSSLIDRAWNTSYTENSPGWIIYSSGCDNGQVNLTIGSMTLVVNRESGRSSVSTAGCFPIKSGTTWKISGGFKHYLYFAPMGG